MDFSQDFLSEKIHLFPDNTVLSGVIPLPALNTSIYLKAADAFPLDLHEK